MGGGTILVTGGSGFTGRYVIENATAAGYRCVSMCRTRAETEASQGAAVTADLLDYGAILSAVEQVQPDHVIHLAAVAFVGHGTTSEIYQSNLLGSVNLLQALQSSSLKLGKVLLASSANVYGNAASLPISEATPPAPVNHYANSKLAMESAAHLFDQLPLLIIRPFNYTGRGQHINFLVPKLVDAFRRRKDSIQLGNLDVARDFSDVRDVARAYVALLDADTKTQTLQVCSGKATSLQEIIDQLGELSGHSLDIRSNPELVRRSEIPVLYGTPERLEGVIGSYRQHSLRDTLAWMLDEPVTRT